MDQLIDTFHIDWKLLIAQIINFAIVLGVLYYFALKPLMKVMNKRSSDIEQSLENAKKVEQQLRDAEEKKDRIVTEAKKEAQIIAANASKEAEKLREEKLHQTRAEMEKLSERAKQDIRGEKEQMMKEAKQELADIVVAASSKVIGKEVDAQTNKELIEKTVNETSTHA